MKNRTSRFGLQLPTKCEKLSTIAITVILYTTKTTEVKPSTHTHTQFIHAYLQSNKRKMSTQFKHKLFRVSYLQLYDVSFWSIIFICFDVLFKLLFALFAAENKTEFKIQMRFCLFSLSCSHRIVFCSTFSFCLHYVCDFAEKNRFYSQQCSLAALHV